LQIHFLHVKPPANSYKKVVPLLIVHGWPGNVYEFYKIIPMLTDPKKHGIPYDFAFEVVAPSIPGYGWSEAAHKTGLNTLTTARIFKKLMQDRLKFKKFIAQGGDWGSGVVSHLGRFFPESVYGVHVNMLFISLEDLSSAFKALLGSYYPSLVFSDPAFSTYSLKNIFFDIIKESGYFHIQATRPDTVGVGLNDSPLGLLAYIGEKFSVWTNKLYMSLDDGGLEKKYTKDEILTIVTIYWINQNILSSARYYKENFSTQEIRDVNKIFVKAPTGYAAFPNDIGSAVPIEMARKTHNITQYTLMRDGGHFAAFEVPKVLANDVFAFARKQVP